MPIYRGTEHLQANSLAKHHKNVKRIPLKLLKNEHIDFAEFDDRWRQQCNWFHRIKKEEEEEAKKIENEIQMNKSHATKLLH